MYVDPFGGFSAICWFTLETNPPGTPVAAVLSYSVTIKYSFMESLFDSSRSLGWSQSEHVIQTGAPAKLRVQQTELRFPLLSKKR